MVVDVRKKPDTSKLYVGLLVIGILCLTLPIISGGVAAYEPDEQNAEDLNGVAIYENEELKIDFTGSDLDVSSGDTVYLVRYTNEPEYTVEDTYELDDSLVASEISTSDIPTGSDYAFADSTDQGNLTAEFTLLSNDLSTEWEQATASTDDQVELDVVTTRSDSYTLTINADGIGYDKLAALFENDAIIQKNREAIPFERLGYDPEETTVDDVIDDGYLTISDWKTENGNLRADFNQLSNEEAFPEPGEYTFNFMIAGTGERDSSTIRILEGTEKAKFSKNVYGEPAGDMATFSFSLEGTDETFIQITDGSTFADVLYVKLDNEQEPASVQVNTRLLGTNHRSLDGAGDVYQTQNIDVFVSAYHDGPSERYNTPGETPFNDGTVDGTASPTFEGVPIFGTGNGDKLSYEEYLRATGLIGQGQVMGDQINQPLQPTDYRLAIGGYKNVGSGQGIFNAETGRPFDALDTSKLVLQKPGIQNVSVYKLGGGAADGIDNIGETVSGKTEAERIAWGDRMVVEYKLTGIYGTIAGGGVQREVENKRLTEGFDTALLEEITQSQQDITFDITAQPPTDNQGSNTVNLLSDGGATYAMVDYDANALYVVVNTRDPSAFTGGLPSNGIPFEANVSYSTSDEAKIERGYAFADGDPMNGAFSVNGENPYHPYVPVSDSATGSERIVIAPPQATFQTKAFGITPLQKGSSVEIAADTNIAGGRGGVMRVESKSRTVVSAGDISTSGGEITAGPLDLTKFNHGEEVKITVKVKDVITKTTDGVVVDDPSDVVLTDDGAVSGVANPDAIENGQIVSEIVDWGDSPPANFQESQETNTTNQTENATNQTEDQNGQAATVDVSPESGTSPDNQDGTNPAESADADATGKSQNSIGLGFIPLIGVVLFSLITGAAAAVVL